MKREEEIISPLITVPPRWQTFCSNLKLRQPGSFLQSKAQVLVFAECSDLNDVNNPELTP